MRRFLAAVAAAAVWGASAQPVMAQPGDPTALIAAQRQAMEALAWTHGRWQGEAWVLSPDGRRPLIQTERVGPMLDGAIVLVEGKAFEPDGRPSAFNALGVMSFDPARSAYAFQSHAQGRAGVFPMEVSKDRFAWTIASGPMKIRYVATHEAGLWREVGDVIAPDGKATRIFEMTLRRLGDTDWPMAGAAKAPQP